MRMCTGSSCPGAGQTGKLCASSSMLVSKCLHEHNFACCIMTFGGFGQGQGRAGR